MIRPITIREKEILHLIAYEHTMVEIAAQLFLSIETIKSHRKNLYQKLNVKNTAGLIRRAFELRLLALPQVA